MRDISEKICTLRTARARARLRVSSKTIRLLKDKKIPKGDPFPVAKVSAVQAAKNTSQLIPYCHPIPIDHVDCRFEIGKDVIAVETEVKAVYKTGVEMEALAAASAAVLTLYDMMKMLDENMEILGIRLLSKKGGKSDFAASPVKGAVAAVLVMSDSVSKRSSKDTSGKLIVERLRHEGFRVSKYVVIADDRGQIEKNLVRMTAGGDIDLILTTGGTGLGPRDNTPEATAKVIEREAQGIGEILRSYGQRKTPFAMLSRGRSGVRGKTLIVNLPGSPKGVMESLHVLFPAIHHALKMMTGQDHR